MSSLSRQGADVRINEVNLSSSLIQNSNAVAALVGVSKQGPVGPTFYSSFDRFTEDWGQPDASVSFDHYAVKDYFREGNSLWAARAVNTDSLYGMLLLATNTTGQAYGAIGTGQTAYDPTLFDPATVYPGGSVKPIYLFYPTKGPGSYSGTLSMAIQSQNLGQVIGVAVSLYSNTGGTLGTSTYEYRVAGVNKEGLEFRCSSPVTFTPPSGTTNQIKVTWPALSGAVAYKIYGRTSGVVRYMTTVGAGTLQFIDNGSITPDAAKEPYYLVTDIPSNGYSDKFQVNVYDSTVSSVSPVESFDVTLHDGIDELGLATECVQRINGFSRYIRVISYTNLLVTVPPLRNLVKMDFATGDSGSAPSNTVINKTWDVFRDKERYTIDVLINAGRSNPTVQSNMDAIAQTRGDCVAFLDVPSASQKAQSMVDYRNLTLNLNTTYSSLFGPDIFESDEYTGKLLYVPPSGAMAGLMARTTRVGQPWFSIAGLNRGLVSALDIRYKYQDAEATLLANAQVNYMRKFVGRGIPLWEQWTLSNQASALQFLNVRVLCNVIKRSMYEYLLYALQEPNDDILRRQIKYGLEEYLKYVQGARGISSFNVICDSTNNTPALVNSGTLAVAVSIVPIIAVRQINLTLIVGKYGLQITESDVAALSA